MRFILKRNIYAKTACLWVGVVPEDLISSKNIVVNIILQTNSRVPLTEYRILCWSVSQYTLWTYVNNVE